MKRLLIFTFCMLISAGIAWLGGYDFNERGFGVAVITVYAIIISGLVAGYPGWKD